MNTTTVSLTWPLSHCGGWQDDQLNWSYPDNRRRADASSDVAFAAIATSPDMGSEVSSRECKKSVESKITKKTFPRSSGNVPIFHETCCCCLTLYPLPPPPLPPLKLAEAAEPPYENMDRGGRPLCHRVGRSGWSPAAAGMALGREARRSLPSLLLY